MEPGIQVSSGARVWLDDGTQRDVTFTISFNTEDIWEASERGAGITEQMVEDWIEEKIKKGRIKAIQITPEEITDKTEPHGIIVDEGCKDIPISKRAVPLVFEVGNDKDRLSRVMRAMNESYSIMKRNGAYTVTPLKTGQAYQVYVDLPGQKGYCTCMDFQMRGKEKQMPCKHIYAVAMLVSSKEASFIKEV